MLYFRIFLSGTAGFNLEMNGNADVNVAMMNSNAHVHCKRGSEQELHNCSGAQKAPFSNFHRVVNEACFSCRVVSCRSFKADKSFQVMQFFQASQFER